jgi:hypothetical protein
MRRCRFTQSLCALAVPLAGLLFAMLAVPAGAQATHESPTRSALLTGYDRAHEITVDGTIESVVAQRVPGSPVGLHVILASSQGTFDTHLGPYLSKETQEALHTGTPIQIVGAIEKVHERSYLLAREMNLGGTVITIRNQHGLLAQHLGPRPKRSANQAIETRGGAQ